MGTLPWICSSAKRGPVDSLVTYDPEVLRRVQILTRGWPPMAPLLPCASRFTSRDVTALVIAFLGCSTARLYTFPAFTPCGAAAPPTPFDAASLLIPFLYVAAERLRTARIYLNHGLEF